MKNLTGYLIQCDIPEYMHDGISLYINHGIHPGGFLTAVIENNLKEACMRADDFNIKILPNYVRFFYNYAPSGCWGSPVENWKGLNNEK